MRDSNWSFNTFWLTLKIVKQKTSEQVKTLITLPIYFNDFWPNMGVKKANKIASGKSTIVNYDLMTEKLPIVQL